MNKIFTEDVLLRRLVAKRDDTPTGTTAATQKISARQLLAVAEVVMTLVVVGRGW